MKARSQCLVIRELESESKKSKYVVRPEEVGAVSVRLKTIRQFLCLLRIFEKE